MRTDQRASRGRSRGGAQSLQEVIPSVSVETELDTVCKRLPRLKLRSLRTVHPVSARRTTSTKADLFA